MKQQAKPVAEPKKAKNEKPAKQQKPGTAVVSAVGRTVEKVKTALAEWEFLNNLKEKIKSRKEIKKAKKMEAAEIVPNILVWNVITTLILVATLVWHLEAVTGWLNGNTMVTQFGMDPVIAKAIAECPDILFYSTYIAFALSLALLVVTAVVLYRFLINKMSGYVALIITMVGSIVSAWGFPLIHAFADLAATPIKIKDTAGIVRDTHMFDVFQLGIEGWPLLVITAVCCAILWVNKRIDNMID